MWFEQFQNVYFTPKLSNFYEDITTKDTASANLKKQSGSYLESKFSYGLDYDMRNQRFQTTDGFRSRFNQSIPIVSDEYSFGNTYDFKTDPSDVEETKTEPLARSEFKGSDEEYEEYCEACAI